MQKGLFLVIANIQQQGEVFIAVLFKAMHCVFRPGNMRRNIHGTCALAGSTWQPSPGSHPAAHVKQTGAAPLAFAQLAAALLPVLIQFRIWASCHLRALWETSEKFFCVGVSISTCLRIFSLESLWAWDQGAARAALLTVMYLWQRLPPHQPNWQKETHVCLDFQHLKPKCSPSAYNILMAIYTRLETVSEEAQVSLSSLSCGVGVPCTGTKWTVDKTYQTFMKFVKYLTLVHSKPCQILLLRAVDLVLARAGGRCLQS